MVIRFIPIGIGDNRSAMRRPSTRRGPNLSSTRRRPPENRGSSIAWQDSGDRPAGGLGPSRGGRSAQAELARAGRPSAPALGGAKALTHGDLLLAARLVRVAGA